MPRYSCRALYSLTTWKKRAYSQACRSRENSSHLATLCKITAPSSPQHAQMSMTLLCGRTRPISRNRERWWKVVSDMIVRDRSFPVCRSYSVPVAVNLPSISVRETRAHFEVIKGFESTLLLASLVRSVPSARKLSRATQVLALEDRGS